MKRKALWTRVKFRADSNSVQNPSWKFWHPPVCQNYKCEKRMCIWQHMSVPTCWDRRKAQQKIKERWCKRISCDIEGDCTIGVCVSRFLSEKVYSTWNWSFGIRNTPSNSPKKPGNRLKFGKERVHREKISKSVRLMSVVFARQNSGKDHMRRPCTKKDAPAKKHGIWRKLFTIPRIRTKLLYILLLKQM